VYPTCTLFLKCGDLFTDNDNKHDFTQYSSIQHFVKLEFLCVGGGMS